jgi:hypothetical protein
VKDAHEGILCERISIFFNVDFTALCIPEDDGILKTSSAKEASQEGSHDGVMIGGQQCTDVGRSRMNLIPCNIWKYSHLVQPPLWSSGQSSWLQIRRPGFDSRHYKKKVVGLERGPLSLVTTTEELLDRKVAAPV